MEEKILAKLDSMQNQMNEMKQKMDEMDQKFERKFDEVNQDVKGLKQEVSEIKEDVGGLKQEVSEIKKNVDGLEKKVNEIKEDVEVVTDQMFVLEHDYGRKINIMFEELMARNERTEGLETNLMALQRRVDKNSAFIINYENQNTTLEGAKK